MRKGLVNLGGTVKMSTRLWGEQMVQVTDPILVAEILRGAHPVDKPPEFTQALVKVRAGKSWYSMFA